MPNSRWPLRFAKKTGFSTLFHSLGNRTRPRSYGGKQPVPRALEQVSTGRKGLLGLQPETLFAHLLERDVPIRGRLQRFVLRLEPITRRDLHDVQRPGALLEP